MSEQKQLVEVCEKGHNYRAAHEHSNCPVPVEPNMQACNAKVIDRYFIKVGSDA